MVDKYLFALKFDKIRLIVRRNRLNFPILEGQEEDGTFPERQTFVLSFVIDKTLLQSKCLHRQQKSADISLTNSGIGQAETHLNSFHHLPFPTYEIVAELLTTLMIRSSISSTAEFHVHD